MNIFVNGKSVSTLDLNLSYDQVVRLADRDPDTTLYTVTWFHSVPFHVLPGERGGALIRGQSVPVTPDMHINCFFTGNA